MDKSNLVSIMVLSYKNVEYLNECLDSIFTQTYENIELIVSNDGANDFDKAFVEKHINRKKGNNIKNVIVNKNEKNMGTVKHCNIALDLSSGAYLMFIACDDAYNNPNAVKDMVMGFDKVPKDVESIVGQTGMYDQDLDKLLELYVSKKDQKQINKLSPQELYSKHLVHRALFPAASRIYKREVFEKYGRFDEKYFLIEDWTSSFQHAKKGLRTYYLDIMCVNHRDGGVSHSGFDPSSFAHKMYVLDWIKGLEEVFSDKTIEKKSLKIINAKRIFRRKMYHETFKPTLKTENNLSNENKLFSVVILCYQNFPMLLNSVRSVLVQKHSRIELIISDDASSFFDEKLIVDEIETHIKECEDDEKKCNIERYKILRNSHNLGTVKNLKTAMNEVTGDFYVTMGADDELNDKSVLGAFASTFATYGDDLWWICGLANMYSANMSTYLNTYPDSQDIAVLIRRDPVELYSVWSRKYIAVTPGMAFRTGIADLVGGYDSDNYKYFEDWPLVLKLLRSEILPVYINKITVKHSTGGISHENFAGNLHIKEIWLKERQRIFSLEVEPYLDRLYPEDLRAYHQNLEWMEKYKLLDLGYFQSGYKSKLKMLLTNFRVVKWVAGMHLANIKTKFFAATSDWYKLISLSFIAFTAAVVGYNIGYNDITNLIAIIAFMIASVFLLAVMVRIVWSFIEKLANTIKHYYTRR